MSIAFAIMWLTFGFLLLIKGAAWLVDGASSLAPRFGISPIMIGLTIVAFGTSTPELIVNIMAAHQKNAALCFGNIIGSNTVNLLLILGIAALIRPLTTERNTVWREIPFALMGVLAMWVLAFDAFWDRGSTNVHSAGDSIILLLFFTFSFDSSQRLVSDHSEEHILVIHNRQRVKILPAGVVEDVLKKKPC